MAILSVRARALGGLAGLPRRDARDARPQATRPGRPAPDPDRPGRLRLDHPFGRLGQAGPDRTGAWANLGLINDVIVFAPVPRASRCWSGAASSSRERALRWASTGWRPARLGRYLVLRSRQSIGLMMPVVLVFLIRRDVIGRCWPGWEQNALASPIEIALLGTLVLAGGAAVHPVRLAHAIRCRMAPCAAACNASPIGPASVSRMCCVWDTGHCVLNACVTGVLPGFRYVLLTDALVETMTPVEVAAVFGHEIGHIAHRHLLYFGFFFAGSLGMLTLLADGVTAGMGWIAGSAGLPEWFLTTYAGVAEELFVLVLPGPVLLAGFRPSVAAIRASGRRVRQQGRVVRDGRLSAARRLRRRADDDQARAARTAPLPRGPAHLLRRPGDRGPVQRHGARATIVAARQRRQPDPVPRTPGAQPGRGTSLPARARPAAGGGPGSSCSWRCWPP